MGFSKDVSGIIVKQTSADAFVYNKTDKGFAGTAAEYNGSIVVHQYALTGWWEYSQKSGLHFYATTSTRTWSDGTTHTDYIVLSEGWSATGQSLEISGVKSQDIVTTIVNNNKRIFENNLLCARFASKLNASQRQTLYDLQTRLQNRNAQLLNDGLVTIKQQSAPAGYTQLQSYMTSFMANDGAIGSAVVAYIVISAVVIASLSTAAYFAYKYYAEESTKDVKFSDDLTKALVAKLTPEEYEQLMSETKGLVTKATLKERFSSNIKWWLLGGGALAILAGAGWFANQRHKKQQ